MPLPYVDINQAISADGLRLILVQGMPSAWGIAVRAMMEYKSLSYTPVSYTHLTLPTILLV